MGGMFIKLGMAAAKGATSGAMKLVTHPQTLPTLGKVGMGAVKVVATTAKITGAIVGGLFAAHFMGF